MELKVAARTVQDEMGICRTYSYSLLVDQIVCGSFACEDYGVRIAEQDGEQASIRGITTSAMRIDELMTLLVEHSISPATLHDVVADWL